MFAQVIIKKTYAKQYEYYRWWLILHIWSTGEIILLLILRNEDKFFDNLLTKAQFLISILLILSNSKSHSQNVKSEYFYQSSLCPNLCISNLKNGFVAIFNIFNLIAISKQFLILLKYNKK